MRRIGQTSVVRDGTYVRILDRRVGRVKWPDDPRSQAASPGRHCAAGDAVAVIEVDPERARYVRSAFDLFATDNFTLATLTDILEKAGLRTRETLKRPGKPLSRSMVH